MKSSIATASIILTFLYILFQLDGLFAFSQHESADPYKCYDPQDKGLTYNGNVNVTNNGKSCLPWTNVTQCFKHPYKLGLKINNLQHNYCRNPDNSQQPWCYTNKACGFDFCDVDLCKPDQKVECKPPSTPIDGLVVGTIRPYYRLGEQVQFQCKSYISKVSKTCLSNGQWSEAGTACIDKSQCYDPRDKGLTYKGHVNVTNKQNTCLPWDNVKHCNWHPYTKELKIDNLEHNYCRNPDNSTQPWCYKDDACHYDYCDVCRIDAPREDFLDSQCPDLINSNPSMCEDFPQFADKFCYKTCHIKGCDVPKLLYGERQPNLNTVDKGEIVFFDCFPKAIEESGDRERVCQPSGTLTGKPLVCKDIFDKDVVLQGVASFAHSKVHSIPVGIILLGVNDLFTVKQAGTVAAWEYSSGVVSSDIYFQIWRQTKNSSNIYKLVGENKVHAPSRSRDRYMVPRSQRIHVENGDVIGVLGSGVGGLHYSQCDEQVHPRWAGLARSKLPQDISAIEANNKLFVFVQENICITFEVQAVLLLDQ